jgi:hypothetical protein
LCVVCKARGRTEEMPVMGFDYDIHRVICETCCPRARFAVVDATPAESERDRERDLRHQRAGWILRPRSE